MALHIFLHFARTEADRKVRPSLRWLIAALLLAFAVWSWLVPAGGDPEVPVGLIWVIRILLPMAFAAVTSAAIREMRRQATAVRVCSQCSTPLTPHADGWSCLRCGR